MAFRFFTVPVKDAAEVAAELNAFLRSHRVLTVDRRWVDSGADSFWALCVDYMEGTSAASEKQSSKKRHKDYKEILSPEDFAIFARLRDLRKEVAQAEAVPVYTIFTNEQLAEMVTGRVRSRAEMGQIEGIGEARLDKFADQFLAILNEAMGDPDEASGKSV